MSVIQVYRGNSTNELTDSLIWHEDIIGPVYEIKSLLTEIQALLKNCKGLRGSSDVNETIRCRCDRYLK